MMKCEICKVLILEICGSYIYDNDICIFICDNCYDNYSQFEEKEDL